MIEFDAEKHIYKVDGVRVPSVSEVTECLHRMAYKDAPPDLMEMAAIRGTTVHEATVALDAEGEVSISGDLAPYLQAYAQFLEDHEPKWLKTEWRVNHGLEYAGTLDRYGMFNGSHCILDIKTTSRIGRETKALYNAAQNLYRWAIQADYPVDKLWILQLKKDATYKLIELPVEDKLAQACWDIYCETQRIRRKRK